MELEELAEGDRAGDAFLGDGTPWDPDDPAPAWVDAYEG